LKDQPVPVISRNPYRSFFRGARTWARGAIFVEAIIIIASMTMMFMGLVFLRMLYVHAAISSRLARGGAIAYSMSGCDSVAPKAWIGTDAKRFYTVLPPNAPSNDTATTTEPMATQGSSNATTATNDIPGLSGGGKGFLNPIAEVADSANVSSVTGGIAQRRTLFKKHLQPRSFVTCGDVVRNGDFEEVFGYVKSVFGGKI
jgi:hypothetical protein